LIETAAEPLVIPAPVMVEVDYWISQRLSPGALVGLLGDIATASSFCRADRGAILGPYC
jgi:hypothetical protein